MSENIMPSFDNLPNFNELEEAINLAPTKDEFYKGLLDDNTNLSLENEELLKKIKNLDDFILKKQTELEKANTSLQHMKGELKNKKSIIKNLEKQCNELEKLNQNLVRENEISIEKIDNYIKQINNLMKITALLKEKNFDMEKYYSGQLEKTKEGYALYMQRMEILFEEAFGKNHVDSNRKILGEFL